MASTLGSFQTLLLLALGIGAVAFQAWALIDALRYPAEAYAAAGKLTRQGWLLILGVSLAIGIITFRAIVFSMGWIAVVPAGLYFADVRPALEQITGGRRRR